MNFNDIPIATSTPKRVNVKIYQKEKLPDMVVNAIKQLNNRNGSSLQAIKKFMAATYLLDLDKVGPFINKVINTAVASGTLIQTKGKGASGSFKLSKMLEKIKNGTSYVPAKTRKKETHVLTPIPEETTKTSEKELSMVINAIKQLNDSNGSSLQAIKKFIAATYHEDVDKLGTFINKAIIGAVASGTLIQTKGRGASGYFKLPDKTEKKTAIVKKIQRKNPTHQTMIINAIKQLNKTNGSSLQAIKKFIAARYHEDVDKLGTFINKAIIGAVASGTLIQTKGRGASGSFKLNDKSMSKTEEKTEIMKKIQRKNPTHQEMIINAIKQLNETNGSSLQAIKKFIAATYHEDVDKLGTFINKAIIGAVASGTLIQTKGRGASGSFKLAGKKKISKETTLKKNKPGGGDVPAKKGKKVTTKIHATKVATKTTKTKNIKKKMQKKKVYLWLPKNPTYDEKLKLRQELRAQNLYVASIFKD